MVINSNGAISFRVNQSVLEDKYIELWVTVMGSIRVTCLDKENPIVYELNWCAGPELEHVNFLLSKVLSAVKNDNIIFCSKIKPYFNDNNFTQYLNQIETTALRITQDDLNHLRQKHFENLLSTNKNT